ncbi:MAG: hydroxyisourate hydrolase [Spirochaetales bacterium]|nr:hydroxyisourate hydrolase [Spirochaetales bacterium]
MSAITTHILDLSTGRPAAGVRIVLEILEGSWQALGHGETDADGRLKSLLPPGTTLKNCVYRLTFATGSYLEKTAGHAFYPEVQISFQARSSEGHYHIPLLLSPFGYSTYRGS